jgi:2-succinyl-5-enolpyruvyl-6-hydroxy-3-cyclohexene-1-carboxylate synthase
MSNLGIAFASTLVDQWVRLGVRHAVISPGSRSTPLAVACLSHEGLSVHVHHDERAASFIALGIGRATGRPAVVVTTSGTATTHLHGAVVEAFQAGVPMLVATADRPPELQGVGAPQTIDQRDLFGRAVRWFVEPGPPTVEGRGHWRRLASDAFAATLGTPPGPVHLNLAFREPLVGPDGSGVAMEPPPDDADDRGGVAMRWQPPDEVLLRFLGSGSAAAAAAAAAAAVLAGAEGGQGAAGGARAPVGAG